MPVLFLGDLGSALLVLVGGHDLVLQSLQLVGLCADALNLLLFAGVLNLKLGHLAGEAVFHLVAGRESGLRFGRHFSITDFY